MSPSLLDVPVLLVDTARLLTEKELYERKVVWFLCNFLQQRGFTLLEVRAFAGERALEKAPTAKTVMEFVFVRDRVSRLVVIKEGHESHWIELMTGERSEMIVDYHYTVGDADAFDSAMTLFIGTVRGESQ